MPMQGIAQVSGVTLTAATAKTVVQLVAAATNHGAKILGWGVYFKGTSSTAVPVNVKLARQSTAGTMTSLTPAKLNNSLAETILTTAQHTATAEPTTGDTIDVVEVHPQGYYEVIYPLGQERMMGGNSRVGIVCTAPAGVDVTAKIIFEE